MSEQVTFLQVPVNLRVLYEFAARRAWGHKCGFDEGRALHHALGEVFGPKSLQPFRLMVPPRKRDAVIYAYSLMSFDELYQNVKICPPDLAEVFNCAGINHKHLDTSFATDHRLGFDIRIRPFRRVKKVGQSKKSTREIDVYQHAADRNGHEKEWHVENSRESVYRAWLAERLGKAAELESAKLVRFQRTIAVRKCAGVGPDAGGKGVIEGPDAVMQGVLKIKDGAVFSEMISKGLGRHKTYGYGMILLRPANRLPLKG